MGQAACCSEGQKSAAPEGAISANLKVVKAASALPRTPAAVREKSIEGLSSSCPPVPEFSEADILRFSDTPEICRLRGELKAKEQSMEVLQKDACNHLRLIEDLEREAFQKHDEITKFKASHAAQQDVASLVAQLRQRDDDLEKLRMRAASEEATLHALTVEAQTKGDVVEDLVCAITEQARSQVASAAQAALPVGNGNKFV